MGTPGEHQRKHLRYLNAWRDVLERPEHEACGEFNGATGSLRCELPADHDELHQARDARGQWWEWSDAIGVTPEAVNNPTVQRLRAQVAELETQVAALRLRAVEAEGEVRRLRELMHGAVLAWVPVERAS